MVYEPNQSGSKELPETDPRFVSGRWIGFYLQPQIHYGRCWMQLFLRFSEGKIQGDGRDIAGSFFLRGKYNLESAEVWFHKTYNDWHVYYKGRYARKAISGIWYLPVDSGDFVVWSVDNSDPTIRRLKAEAELPVAVMPPSAVDS